MDWQKVKNDLLLAFSSHFLYKIIGYVILTILTRYLSRDAMGEFFFAAALANFFILFTNLATDNYLIREVTANPEKASSYFSEVISLRLPFFVAYFLLLNGFALIFKPALLLLIFLTSVYVFFDDLYQSFGALFLGLKRVRYNVIAGVSTRLLLVVFVFVVVKLNKSLTAILVCYILANSFMVVIAFVLLYRKIGRLKFVWNYDSAQSVFRVSFPFFVLLILGIIHFKVDTLLLGFMKPYSVVASYEAAYKLLEAAQFVTRPVVMIFYPICSEIAARQNWLEIQSLLKKLILITGIMGAGIAFVVVMMAGFIVPMVFGAKYKDSIPVLRILYVSLPALYLATVSGLLAKAMRLEKKIVKITLICAVINIIVNIIVIPPWGALGSAWATVISETILVVWLIKLNFQELQVLCTTVSTNVQSGKELDHVV